MNKSAGVKTLLPVVGIAIDVEKKGKDLDESVIAIGIAFGTRPNNIEKCTFCFKSDAKFETRCYDEFWKNNLDTLAKICSVAEDPKTGWAKVVAYMEMIEKKYPSHKIIIVSDNPDYDAGSVNYELKKHCGRYPLRYNSAGKYRSVEDPGEQMAGLGTTIEAQIKQTADRLCVHDHWPENDAHNILLQWFMCREVIAEKNASEARIRRIISGGIPE